jgi:integrase/recombinase XerD
MMSSAREHYEEAERLLALARAEQDSIRRSLILAEAQVHATLALSAPAGEGPAGPGQDRAADTKSTGTAHQTLASPSPGTPPYAHPRWPKGTDQTPAGPEEYRRFLVNERGLAEVSIRRYLPAVRGFLAGLPSPLEAGLSRLSAAQVSRFVIDHAGLRSVADAKSMVIALRSLLRFLFVTGRIDREFAAAVPTVANRKLSTLPGRLRAGEAGLLLDSCDRDTEVGRRDFAILTVLARLGLRACEAAVMQLSDIDWRAGELTVHGKGGLDDRLPLPADAGEALVDYLLRARPVGIATTSVFLTVRAPRRGIAADGIRGVVAHACQRAGLRPAPLHPELTNYRYQSQPCRWAAV